MYGYSIYGAPYGTDDEEDRLVAQVMDVLTATETWTYKRASLHVDVAHFVETVSTKLRHLVVVFDVAVAEDSFVPRRSYIVSDALTASESYRLARATTVTDQLHYAEVVTPLRRMAARVVDAMSAADAFMTGRATIVSEALHAAEAFRFKRATIVAEVLHAADSHTPKRTMKSVVSDLLTAVETSTSRLTHRAVVTEELCADDLFILPGGKSGLSAPVDGMGMSRYEDLLVNEIAMLDGMLVGVGDAGVYSFDGDTDNGAAIDAWIQTSKWAQGKPSMKRPGYMYIGIDFVDPNIGADMFIYLTHYQNGSPETIAVRAEPHASGGMVSMRFKLPPVRSYYFQYKLYSNGGVWTLDEMRSEFDADGRRV